MTVNSYKKTVKKGHEILSEIKRAIDVSLTNFVGGLGRDLWQTDISTAENTRIKYHPSFRLTLYGLWWPITDNLLLLGTNEIRQKVFLICWQGMNDPRYRNVVGYPAQILQA